MARVTEITVRRPGGEIEMVRKTGVIAEPARRAAEKATAAAGRGEIIKWVEIIPSAHRTQRHCCPSYRVGQGCPLHGDAE